MRISCAASVLAAVFLLLVTAACTYKRTGREAVGEKGGHITDSSEGHADVVRHQKEIIRRQEEQAEDQEKEVEDLKRQKYHNQLFEQYE